MEVKRECGNKHLSVPDVGFYIFCLLLDPLRAEQQGKLISTKFLHKFLYFGFPVLFGSVWTEAKGRTGFWQRTVSQDFSFFLRFLEAHLFFQEPHFGDKNVRVEKRRHTHGRIDT